MFGKNIDFCKPVEILTVGVSILMNYKEIESLKSLLMHLVMRGCKLKNNDSSVNGKIVGMGFRPYWTNPVDSKIEKLEFNYQDNCGQIMPFNLYDVIGYKVVFQDGEEFEDSQNVTLDMHVFSTQKSRETEPYENVRIFLTGE